MTLVPLTREEVIEIIGRAFDMVDSEYSGSPEDSAEYQAEKAEILEHWIRDFRRENAMGEMP
jgi:hypothetical protein